jgi:branched-chain amino acid transport system ATP-binding protein
VTNIFPNLTTIENVQFAVQSRKKYQNPLVLASKLKDVDVRTHEILGLLGLQGKEGLVASGLSHGDQRRLEIAISLATSPELLLMDEPTAGMSPTETDEMIALIPRISSDSTIIIVEHDMKVVMELAEVISVLYYGEIIAEGPPEEIRNNERVLEVYLGGDLSR